MSVAEPTPPKKRPIRADDGENDFDGDGEDDGGGGGGGGGGDGVGLADTHCSFPLIIDTSTPSTITVAFSDDNWKLIRLMRSVAVNEPSSEE